jgi:hypothetical protein
VDCSTREKRTNDQRLKIPIEKWKREGVLDKHLRYIEERSSLLDSEYRIAMSLGVSKQTFITLKKKHKEIEDAINKGKEKLKNTVLSAIYKRAIGFEYVGEETGAEQSSGGVKKRLSRKPKYFPPDLESAKYILVVTFGRDFNPKKDELDIIEKKYKDGNEQWLKLGDEK